MKFSKSSHTFHSKSKTRVFLSAILLTSLLLASFVLSGCTLPGIKSLNSTGNGTTRQTFNSDQMKQTLTQSLSTLVQNNTITSDQETKIIDAITTEMSSRLSNMKRPTGSGGFGDGNVPRGGKGQWTGSRPAGSLRSGGGMYASALTELVTNGSITQAQSDAVTAALGNGFGGFRGGTGVNAGSAPAVN